MSSSSFWSFTKSFSGSVSALSTGASEISEVTSLLFASLSLFSVCSLLSPFSSIFSEEVLFESLDRTGLAVAWASATGSSVGDVSPNKRVTYFNYDATAYNHRALRDHYSDIYLYFECMKNN